MNTKYLINALVGSFRELLAKAKAEGLVIDMAGCKVGPEVAREMRFSYKDVDYINSENSELNDLLKHNCEVSRIVYEEYEEVDVDNIDTIEDLMVFLSRTDLPSKVKFKTKSNSNKPMGAIALLIMSRPDLDVDTFGIAVSLFDLVRKYWIPNAKDHDKYYKIDSGNIIVCDKVEASDIYLPYEFGNTKLFSLDGSIAIDNEWQEVVEGLIMLFRNKSKRHKGKTLLNYVTFRGDTDND